MKGYIIGKILVVIIILTPVFFLDSCEAQDSRGKLEFQKDPEDQVADRDGHRR